MPVLHSACLRDGLHSSSTVARDSLVLTAYDQSFHLSHSNVDMCLCISFAAPSSVKITVNTTTTLPVGYYNYTVAYNQGKGSAGLVLSYNTSSSTKQVCSRFAHVLLVCNICTACLCTINLFA